MISRRWPLSVAVFLASVSAVARGYYAFTREVFPSGPDAPTYIGAAEAIAAGGIFAPLGYVPFFPVGYPLFLAIFAGLAPGDWFWIAQGAQILILSGAIIALHRLLTSADLPAIANLSVVILLLSPTLTAAAASAMYETLLGSLVLLGSVALIGKRLSAVRVGGWLLLSAAILVQPKTAPIALVWLVLALRDVPWRLWLGRIVLVLFFPALGVARNGVATGEWTLANNLPINVRAGVAGFARKACPEDDVVCLLSNYLDQPRAGVAALGKRVVLYWSPHSAKSPFYHSTWYHNISIRGLASRVGIDPGGGYRWVEAAAMLALLFSFAAGVYVIRGERRLLLTLAFPALLFWVVSVGTSGDSRHRVATMIFVVPVQLIAVRSGARWVRFPRERS